MTRVNKGSAKAMHQSSMFAGPYLLGFIGSAVYFIQIADGFGEVIVAILKALVWPAFLVHRVFELLNI